MKIDPLTACFWIWIVAATGAYATLFVPFVKPILAQFGFDF
jgi:hypothetical protein